MHAEMDIRVSGLTTKSDKIRTLARAGYSRSQIADYLNIRYQHVRNVLVDEERKNGGGRLGMAEAEAPFEHQKKDVDVRWAVRVDVAPDGALTLPSSILAAAGLATGGFLLVRFADDEIRMMTLEATTRKIQAMVRQSVPDGVSLVDELIAERREEAKREFE
jgi:hypothetical protein